MIIQNENNYLARFFASFEPSSYIFQLEQRIQSFDCMHQQPLAGQALIGQNGAGRYLIGREFAGNTEYENLHEKVVEK